MEDVLPPQIDPEEPSGDEDNVEEEHVAARDIWPKRSRRIKYKLVGEDDTKIGIMVAVGKRNRKHKDKVWIKTEDNTTVYDVNTDLESWKYAEIVFDK